MDNMKILFVAPLPPPLTGNSLAAKIILDELNNKHELLLINLSKGNFEQGINSFERIITIAGILKEVWVKNKEADVIYLTLSQSISGNIRDILFYSICFRNLSKVIVHLHGGGIKSLIFDKYSILKIINKFFLRKLGGIIVLGKSLVNIFSDMVIKEKIYIVPNFAEDFLFIDEKRIKSKFLNVSPLKVLFMSNLIEGKGYLELLDAYLKLTDLQKNNIRIDFAGSFNSIKEKNIFLNLIKEHKQICYHGIVKGLEKKKLFTNAHVFCLPTYYAFFEGQPISIIEAYASGCVVLATDHGGIKDIFQDRINGFEIQKKSSESIRQTLEKIIRNTKQLLPIAISNQKIALNKFRVHHYINSMKGIIEKKEIF